MARPPPKSKKSDHWKAQALINVKKYPYTYMMTGYIAEHFVKDKNQ